MKILLLSAIAFVLVMAVVSCKMKKNMFDQSHIVGTWRTSGIYSVEKENGVIIKESEREVPREEAVVMTFDGDGTWRNAAMEEDFPVRWKLSGNEIMFNDGGGWYTYMTVEAITPTELIMSYLSQGKRSDGIICEEYERTIFSKITN